MKLVELHLEYYNPIYIRNKLIILKNEYLKIGKINISIKEHIVKDGYFVDLQIDISEGNKFYINNIIISGLDKINNLSNYNLN